MQSDTELLRLDDQLCFPLYAASRLVTKCYQPVLDALQITYPQYLVLLVLWEHDNVNLTDIGKRLHLQSNTLTPLLKRMQQMQWIDRARATDDERNIMVALTEKGKMLKEKAVQLPHQLMDNMNLSTAEVRQLHQLLYKLIGQLA